MKFKYEQTIAELGIEDAKFSKGVLKAIQDVVNQKAECDRLVKKLVGYHEDDRNELEAGLQVQQDILNDLDFKAAEKIAYWDSKKEVWAENAKKLADYRSGKPAAAKPSGAISDAKPPKAKVAAAAATTVVTATATEPYVAPLEMPVYEQQPPVEEKNNDWTWWLLAGIVGVATLGAVIMKKK
jgi:peptidoglycan hydrolase CwlO-like protein